MCSLEKSSDVYILTLTGDGEHRLNPNVIASIRSAVSQVKSEVSAAGSTVRGSALITTAEGKYFSNGYDLAWAFSTPHSTASTKRNLIQMSSELRLLILDLISLPIPTIAAVTGHAAAAGMILALSHDYVVMRSDRGFLYMSELELGLKIPRCFVALVKSKVSRVKDLRDILLAAEKLPARRGKEIGVVDEAYDGVAETLAGARRLAKEVATSGEAYGERRKKMLCEVIEAIGFDETVEGDDELPAMKIPNSTQERRRDVSKL